MRAILLTLVFALTGCNTNVVKKDYDFDHLVANKGIVILSITNNNAGLYKGANSFAPTITVRNIRTAEEFQVDGIVGTAWEKHLLNNDGHPIGRVVILDLDAGAYTISNFSTVITGTSYYSAKDKPNIVFNVRKSEVIYIGNVNFYIDEANVKFKVSVTDRSDRDLPHAKIKWPNLRLDKIVTSIATNKMQKPAEPDSIEPLTH